MPYCRARHGAGSKPGGYGAQNRVSVRTKGDGEVSLHPTSICFGLPSFEHRFLLFHEKVRTTKVYIRDATMVGPYPLLLFGGKVKVDHERAVATCDDWIHFRAAPRVAVLFKVRRRGKTRPPRDRASARPTTNPSLKYFVNH